MDGCGRVCGGFGMNNLVGLRKDLATDNAENFRVICGADRYIFIFHEQANTNAMILFSARWIWLSLIENCPQILLQCSWDLT